MDLEGGTAPYGSFRLKAGSRPAPWGNFMPAPKHKTDKKRVAAKPRPAKDKGIKAAEHTAVSSFLILGVAVIVAALIVYGVTFKPRPTSAPTPLQPQPSYEAAIPPASQPAPPPPQQPQPSFEAAIPPASQPVAPPRQSPSPVPAPATPSSQPTAKPQVPESVQYECRYGAADKIIVACGAWIRLDPDSAEAYEHRAFADYLKDLTDQAIADDTKAIALDPHRASVYYFRGQAYEKKQLRDQAVADYRAAVKLDPNYGNPQDALQRLGVAP